VAVLDKFIQDPLFWSDPQQAQVQVREAERLRRSLHDYSVLERVCEDLDALIELGGDTDEIEELLDGGERCLAILHRSVMFARETDGLPVILEVNSGAGGLESEDFAFMLARMYQRWATQNGFTVEATSWQEGEGKGLKSCVMNIFGDNVYGRLRSEIGVHRLVRVSPFDKKNRTHTSFASINVVPLIDDNIEVKIADGDLEWDFFRSGGAGGQAVNKVETAVRVTHIPSGLIVKCQQAREQRENRDIALKMLRSKLYDIELNKRLEAIGEAREKMEDVSFGSQIRSYIMSGNRNVKDHRTGFVSSDVSSVFDGDIDGFIRSYLLRPKTPSMLSER